MTPDLTPAMIAALRAVASGQMTYADLFRVLKDAPWALHPPIFGPMTLTPAGREALAKLEQKT